MDAKRQQKRILSYVRSCLRYLDKSPTIREISQNTNIDMLTVFVALQVMIDKGLLGRDRGRKVRYLTLPH